MRQRVLGWHGPCFASLVNALAADPSSEVLAVLMPEGDPSCPATVLLRRAGGGLEVRSLPSGVVLADRRLRGGRVRPGTPIYDPASREVVGYELVAVAAEGG
jgi:hypothetical protein